MIQWLQSQAPFLLIVLVIWLIITSILYALSHDNSVSARTFNRFFQLVTILLLIGNFTACGPSVEFLKYLRIHWLFSVMLIYSIAFAGLLMTSLKYIFSGAAILCLDLIFMQIIFQKDWLTVIHLVIFFLIYMKILFIIAEYEPKFSLSQLIKNRIKSLLPDAN